MVKLAELFRCLTASRIAVIGDFMLDRYTIGKAKRISPEAPVAIINVQKEEQRAGGAGNAVLNLVSLGADTIPIGRLGADTSGTALRELFDNENIPTHGLFIEPGHLTPVKNRIIADAQQIVRVDHEIVRPLSERMEQQVIEALPSLLAGVNIIAISDYGKGFLTPTLIAAIIDYANTMGCPVIVDPKGVDFSKYRGATIIKPNLSEVYAAAQMTREAPIELAAAKVLKTAEAQVLMVTRSEDGISLFYPDGKQIDFPVQIHEVKDVTGAGDTVLAMLVYALASGLDVVQSVPLCNLAAGIAIEHFGCARVTLSDLADRLLKQGRDNKVFSVEQLGILKQALNGKNIYPCSYP